MSTDSHSYLTSTAERDKTYQFEVTRGAELVTTLAVFACGRTGASQRTAGSERDREISVVKKLKTDKPVCLTVGARVGLARRALNKGSATAASTVSVLAAAAATVSTAAAAFVPACATSSSKSACA